MIKHPPTALQMNSQSIATPKRGIPGLHIWRELIRTPAESCNSRNKFALNFFQVDIHESISIPPSGSTTNFKHYLFSKKKDRTVFSIRGITRK
jgi:hypothetical protein